MTTSRSQGNPDCRLDLGAQYISATKEYREKHGSYYSDLLTSGILTPMKSSSVSGMKESDDGGTTEHFVTPAGVSSVVKHYLKGVDVHFGKHVQSMDIILSLIHI